MATIDYNGSTIATLGNGQTATIKCKDMKMEDDVVVSVDGGGDIDALIDGSITEVKSGVTVVESFAFQGRNKLTRADFPKATKIGMSAFSGCYPLKAVILRSGIVCNLSNTNTFSNCYHILGKVNSTHNPNGDKDGYIYVPRALLSYDDATKDYRRATNWSTIASQFRKLESFTVDGTTTGAIDWNKANINWLFNDEYIDDTYRADLPSMEDGFIGKTFTLVVDGVDIETKVYNGGYTNSDGDTQWDIGSGDYILVYVCGKNNVWYSSHKLSGFTCSLRIDN